MSLFDTALEFAREKHKGQKRLDGEDYINHPYRVFEYVGDDDEELACVAILHDVLEDTDTTEQELLSIFPDEVVEAVKIVTRDEKDNYEYFIDSIRRSGNSNAIHVKIGDIKDNLSTIENIPDLDKRKRLKERYEKALTVLE